MKNKNVTIDLVKKYQKTWTKEDEKEWKKIEYVSRTQEECICKSRYVSNVSFSCAWNLILSRTRATQG